MKKKLSNDTPAKRIKHFDTILSLSVVCYPKESWMELDITSCNLFRSVVGPPLAMESLAWDRAWLECKCCWIGEDNSVKPLSLASVVSTCHVGFPVASCVKVSAVHQAIRTRSSHFADRQLIWYMGPGWNLKPKIFHLLHCYKNANMWGGLLIVIRAEVASGHAGFTH